MKLQVTGKNLDVTQPIVDYAERKLTKLAKHLSDSSRVELELAVERNPSISQSQVAEATIWTKGPVLRARESSTDMYASIDLVADKLERQVKRYRERRQRGRPHGHARRRSRCRSCCRRRRPARTTRASCPRSRTRRATRASSRRSAST